MGVLANGKDEKSMTMAAAVVVNVAQQAPALAAAVIVVLWE